MTLATLSDVLQPALANGRAIAGVVTLGWEDMRAYVEAAEAENAPLILQAGPGCRANTPLPILGKMFRHLAQSASVPIVAHLDHGYTRDECVQAIDNGFTSVMFDGSRLPLDENIEQTAEIAALAHAAGVSCEGEIGFVGYADGEQSFGTDPQEAATFAIQTKVDAMAISVGNVHLQKDRTKGLDRERIAAIADATSVPLVIHGGSGVPHTERAWLAKNTPICKFNIGTELRMEFGAALRKTLAANPDEFDKVKILSGTHDAIVAKTRDVLRKMNAN